MFNKYKNAVKLVAIDINSSVSNNISNFGYIRLINIFSQTTLFYYIYINIVKFNDIIIVRYFNKLCLFSLAFLTTTAQAEGQISESYFNNEFLFKFILYLTIINLFTFIIKILINIVDKINFKNISNYLNLFINVFLFLGCISFLYKIYNLYYEFILFDLLFFSLVLYSLVSIITIIGLKQFKKLNLSKIFPLFLVSRMSGNISSLDNPDNTNSNDLTNDLTNNNLNNISNSDELKKLEIAQRNIDRSIGIGVGLGLAATRGQSPAVQVAAGLGGGIATGVIHVGISHLNRTVLEIEKNNKSETSNTQSNACSDNVSSNSDQSTKDDLLNSPKTPTNEIITTNETPSPGSGFINSPYEEFINNPNPVEGLLYNIWVLLFTSLVFLVILFFFYFQNNFVFRL